MNFFLEPQVLPYLVSSTDSLSNVPHLHRHIEIIYVKKGSAIAVCGDMQTDVESGDLFIAFPNQIHYYLANPRTMDIVLLIASPDLCPEFKQDFKSYLPECPVLKWASVNPKIAAAIENIIESSSVKTRYSDPEIKGNLMILLSELLKSLPLEKKKRYDSDLLTEILIYCYDNYTEDISLRTLADALNVSHYYISHIFNQRLHTSFRDYINSLRIEKACDMLKANDLTITEIAFAVGYNSTRTFNRCFQKGMNITPREYREKSGQ